MKSKKIKLFRKYYDIKDEVKTQYDKWLADGKKYDFLLDFSNFSFNVGGELLFMPCEVWPWNEINFKNARSVTWNYAG